METIFSAAIIYLLSRAIEPRLPQKISMQWARLAMSMIISAILMLTVALIIHYTTK